MYELCNNLESKIFYTIFYINASLQLLTWILILIHKKDVLDIMSHHW